jgi:peroxiredoxin
VFNDSTATSEGITTNKYLKDNDKVYRINDLDINENVLILEKEERPFSKIESPQIGFRAPAFTETDLTTKEMVSLEKYRGKYVFLDLWTTGCVPCLQEMPNVKEVYDKIDRSKIEFIGIVGKDTHERLDKIIKTIGINWKLVEANSENLIFNKYKVRAFPTTLLIDPNGIVIKSNFRAKELKIFIENGFSDAVEK